MKALVVTCRDPFRPANHRTANVVKRRRSLRNLAPRTSLPVICQVNGEWISRKAWARRVRDGDNVVFVTLPQGGGGGSNPLKMILMLAVSFFAPYLGTALLGINGAAAIGSLGVSLVNGAIGLLGTALVNALIPAPKPTQAQQATSLAAASPTYSIGAQGNSARLGSPIPAIYGRHQVFPDFAAMPYTEYAGNEQYLYQLFCIGQGEYDIESIRVEDTPISSFSEITYEVTPPGGTVTMFPASVTTSGEVSGQEALTSTTLGPFVANASGTLANYLAIDVVMPRGLYYANDGGGLDSISVAWTVQAQEINDVGTAIGSWVTLGTETHSAATTTPVRLSKKYTVDEGRYQVKLTRTDTKQTDSRYGHELDWAGLRAYIPGSQSYGDVTMVAMRLRATNNLSAQASRKINFIVTRKLKTWNPATGWSATAVPTRSIAWAIADICKANYGAKLPDGRIDLQGMYDLDAVYTARGDHFDAVFDSQSTIMEGLTQASRAGRAVPYVQGGIVHAVRDASASIPVAMFSQRNIIKNSLKIDYVMASEDTADSVDVTYFDSQIWGERTVRATLPAGTSDKPATVKLFGVTDRQQAWNEGMYIAACNRYRRRIVTFSTEMEGFVPTIGDLIAVQHDMPRWGQSGEIVGFRGVTNLLLYSQDFTNANWAKLGATITPNSTAAPDGTTTATSVALASTADYIYLYVAGCAALEAHTASIYVKSTGVSSNILLVLSANGAVYENCTVLFNPHTGVLGTATSGSMVDLAATKESMPNGWYRISLTGRSTNPANTTIVHQLFATQPSCINHYWGAQLERGTSPGDYVRTTSAPDTNAFVITNEPLDWSAGGAHVLAFRTRNGSPVGPFACTAGADAYHVTLTDWTGSSQTPDISGDRERSHYAFGPANEQYIKCRMVTMRPKSAETVEIIAVVESDYVHTADTGVAPGVTAWQLPSRFTSPTIEGLTARSMPGSPDKMIISWQPAAGAKNYIVEQSSGDGSWTGMGDVSTASFIGTALYGAATVIRVAAVGLTKGDWVTCAYGSLADYMWSGDSSLMWTGDSNTMWRY